MVILDTNMILRYLLNDNAEMAEYAENLIENETAEVTTEVIAEVVYVLKGVYHLERNVIVNVLISFLGNVTCQNSEVLHLALKTYGEVNLDFVDCVLYAYHKANGAEIATFDKKLIKMFSD
ncbi:MAG: PIN domain-containing protein [Ruminococcus sp.]|nr:PIN domain-containing protein [Ruminococcus sp.]